SRISPGDREFRGSLETAGSFSINRRWSWGWDATLLTDRYFLNDYQFATEGSTSERISQVYLRGQGSRSYFDARVLGFVGMGRLDNRAEAPLVHPVVDHSYVF